MSKGSTNENNEDVEEKVLCIPTVIIGDSTGCVHILSLNVDFRSSVEHAQKLKNESYFNQGALSMIICIYTHVQKAMI